jgi:hypothetical protein
VRGTTAEWADPYIAYCEAMGIISGYGDGRFGPQDKLTNAAFAKMLLCALGYDAAREGLTGASWEIGVAKLVNKTNLCNKLDDFPYDGMITRDAAAQLAFNTLLQEMVEYKGNGLYVNKDGSFENPMNVIANSAYDYRSNGTNRYRWLDEDTEEYYYNNSLQFIENYYPRWKSYVTTDDYGLNVREWFQANNRTDYKYDESKKVAEGTTDVVMATYTTTTALVSLDTLYKDAAFTKTEVSNKKSLTVIENGTVANAITPEKGTTTPGALKAYVGATVMLVDRDANGVGDILIVKYPLLAKVNKVIAAADSASKEREVELKIFFGENKSVISNFETEKYAKGDYVLVYPDMTITARADKDDVMDAAAAEDGFFTNKIIEVTSCEANVGILDKVNTATSGSAAGNTSALTVAGTKYSVGAANLAAMGPAAGHAVYTKDTAQYGLNKEITLYMSNGYVLGVITTAVPFADYVFVLNSVPNAKDAITGEGSWTVGYVKQDGTTGTVVVNSDPEHQLAKDGTEFSYVNHWCAMTPLGGTALFTTATALGNKESGEVGIDGLHTDKAAVGTILANSATNFVVKSGSVVTTFKAYTGVSNVPTFDKKDGTAYGLIAPTGTAAAIYVDFGKTDADGDTTKPVFFTTAVREGSVIENGITYNTYQVINSTGALEIVKVSAALNPAMGLAVPVVDADGHITALKPANTATYLLDGGKVVDIVAGGGNISGGTVGADKKFVADFTYVVSADTNIFYLNGAKMKEGAELDDLSGKYGMLALVTASPLTEKVSTIYFVPAKKPA